MEPEILAICIPIIALCIPIVKIISNHKLKVEEIRVRGRTTESSNRNEIEAIRSEVRELKELVHEQAIQVDTLISEQRRLMPNATATPVGEGEQRLAGK